jgi:hypothetical protein
MAGSTATDSETELKRSIRDHCRDWPDMVPAERVRECYREVRHTIDSFVEFVAIFEECTGYSWDHTCTRTSVTYADPVLQKVVDELLLWPRITSVEEVEAPVLRQDWNPDFPHVVDIRYLPASLIFTALNLSNGSLKRHPPESHTAALIGQIASGIPSHRRWLVVPPSDANLPLLKRFYAGSFDGFTPDQFRYVNIVEDDAIGWVATYGVDRGLQAKEDYLEAFATFAKSLGLSNYSKYNPPLYLPPRSGGSERVSGRGVVCQLQLNAYAASMGVEPQKIAFTLPMLRTFNLEQLPSSFVPIFARVDSEPDAPDSLYLVDRSLMEVNNHARLCHSLPHPREIILKGFQKGQVFETMVFRLLTGLDSVVVLQARGSEVPAGFILGDRALRPGDRVVRYSYSSPTGHSGFRVRLTRRRGDGMVQLAHAAGKESAELDLVLVHQESPAHILLGECKFAWTYHDDAFRAARGSIERLSIAISENPEFRTGLGLPESLPIVPVAFVSHSGKVLTEARNSLVVPITQLLLGRLRVGVSTQLSNS